MFASGWAMMFNLLQMLDPVYDTEGMPPGQGIPVWPIDNDDAKKLGNVTTLYIESIPANQKNRLKEFLEKHMPLIMFTGTIATVAGPRAQFSFEQKRNALRAKALAAQNGGNLRSVATTHPEAASAESAFAAAFGHDAPAQFEGNGGADDRTNAQ